MVWGIQLYAFPLSVSLSLLLSYSLNSPFESRTLGNLRHQNSDPTPSTCFNMISRVMKLLALLLLIALSAAQSSTTSSIATPAGVMSTSAAASTSTSPEYTITALPAVESQPSCVYNCLIPIGLADSSGCNDVTEDCACLSAPADALDFLTSCVETVCGSSTGVDAGVATSLYESYCNSVYGTAVFSSAFSAEAMATANSSVASVMLSSSSSVATTSSTSASASASSTAKSGSASWSPPP